MSPTLTISSPKQSQSQKTTKSLPLRKTVLILASIIGLLIYYRSLIEFTYKSDIPTNNNTENYDDGNNGVELDAVDLYSIKEHRYKFRVNLKGIKSNHSYFFFYKV